jgi:hypothetical protein
MEKIISGDADSQEIPPPSNLLPNWTGRYSVDISPQLVSNLSYMIRPTITNTRHVPIRQIEMCSSHSRLASPKFCSVDISPQLVSNLSYMIRPTFTNTRHVPIRQVDMCSSHSRLASPKFCSVDISPQLVSNLSYMNPTYDHKHTQCSSQTNLNVFFSFTTGPYKVLQQVSQVLSPAVKEGSIHAS